MVKARVYKGAKQIAAQEIPHATVAEPANAVIRRNHQRHLTEHENDFTMLSDIFPTGWHGVVLSDGAR